MDEQREDTSRDLVFWRSRTRDLVPTKTIPHAFFPFTDVLVAPEVRNSIVLSAFLYAFLRAHYSHFLW